MGARLSPLSSVSHSPSSLLSALLTCSDLRPPLKAQASAIHTFFDQPISPVFVGESLILDPTTAPFQTCIYHMKSLNLYTKVCAVFFYMCVFTCIAGLYNCKQRILYSKKNVLMRLAICKCPLKIVFQTEAGRINRF